MKKLLSITLVLVGMLSFTKAVADDETNKEKREVAEFTKIEAVKGINVMLVQCDHYELEVVSQGCPTTDCITTVKKGTLEVKMKKITKGSAVSIFVYYKDLEEIKLKTGATVETTQGCPLDSKGTLTLDIAASCEVAMDIDVENLVVDANSCKIALAGVAKHQKVDILGTVNADTEYDASRVQSETIEIRASGCDSQVKASKTIKAEADGCVITCKGGAEVEKSTTSGGEVIVKE